MDRYALLGSPIAHSKSPAMMNFSFEKMSLDARYELIETKEDSLPETVERLKREGFAGWNCTMPVKQAMAALCDELSPASRIGGSVNTVKQENGVLTGYTTDGAGLISGLLRTGISVKGKKITLLGTGGAASAIAIQLALDGAGEIAVFANRPSSRAHMDEIAQKLGGSSETVFRLCGYEDPEELRKELLNSAVLINATNVGMKTGATEGRDCLVPDISYLPSGLYVYDVIYHPDVTPLLAMAREAGCNCENGRSMLIGQGAESFRIWTGRRMPVGEVTAVVFP